MLSPPKPIDAAVIYQPLYSQLMMLTALGAHEKLNGLSQWSIESANQMSSAEKRLHTTLRWFSLDALINAVSLDKPPQSIPEFIDAINVLAAEDLRDLFVAHMANSVHFTVGSDYWQVPIDNPHSLLEDFETFEAHFAEIARTKLDSVNFRLVFDLLNDPQRLQADLSSHFQMLWHRFLAKEWSNIESRIQQCVEQFQLLNLEGFTILEAMEVVTGRDLRPAFRLDKLFEFEAIRFVPHMHNGPYIIWFGTSDTLFIGFPIRELESVAPSFDNSTFVNRCKALADENRLSILKALATADSLSTVEIIDRFDLEKSAASRHLRQLVATSLISEERIDKAKKGYRLNHQIVSECIDALRQLL